MNFRTIFILFNAVIGVSFLFLFCLPILAIGMEYGLSFWASNWPLALCLVLALIILDVFFVRNWKLFSLLEREDWPALTHYLETRVVARKEYSARLVRLLANTYLLLSDPGSVIRLEEKIAAVKPAVLDKNALVFGVARILDKNPQAAATFFAAHKKGGKGRDREWLDWYHAFALMLDRDFSGAADLFLRSAQEASDALVIALSANFLHDTLARSLPLRATEIEAAAEKARTRLLEKFPTKEAWEKEIKNAKSELHVVVLTRSIDEATAFLYR